MSSTRREARCPAWWALIALALLGCRRGPSSARAAANRAATVHLRAGPDTACVVRSDGALWCWGRSHTLQLGVLSDASACGESRCLPRPRRIDDAAPARDVSIGGFQLCVLRGDGSVACRGGSPYGQAALPIAALEACTLGGGPTPDCSLDLATGEVRCAGMTTVERVTFPCTGTLRALSGIAGAQSVVAGGDGTCVVSDDGALRCAGGEALSGIAERPDRCPHEARCARTPQPARDPAPVAEVAIGTAQTCVRLREGGRVRCAAHDVTGSRDEQVEAIRGAEQLVVGSSHGCVRRGGAVECFGYNGHGELGRGTREPALGAGTPATSAPVPGLEGVVQLATERSHTCAVRGDGGVWCWGRNVAGQLGDGTRQDSPTPARVEGLPAAREVAVGEEFSCALGRDGTVWCWGSDAYGQLGAAERGRDQCPMDYLSSTEPVPCELHPVQVAGLP